MKMHKSNYAKVVAGLVVAMGTISGVSSAQTPDGETPAEETICDMLSGATPGLYGLCVAYCEAHDGTEDLSSPEARAELLPPNSKILRAYDRKRKDFDPPMPCVVYDNACPAWTEDELTSIGYFGTNGIGNSNDEESQSGSFYSLYDQEFGYTVDNYILNAVAQVYYFSEGAYMGLYGYTDLGNPADKIYRVTELTEEQFDVCSDQIRDHVVPTL